MRGLQDTLVKLTCTIRKNKRLFELSCWSQKFMIFSTNYSKGCFYDTIGRRFLYINLALIKLTVYTFFRATIYAGTIHDKEFICLQTQIYVYMKCK